MIRRIRIQNFGSLVDVDTTLGPLTLLVGPNASGKTMFIRAIRTLTKLLRSSLRGPSGEFSIDHTTLADLVSGTDTTRQIGFAVWLENPNGEPNFEVSLATKDGVWVVVEERIRWGDFEFDSATAPLEFATERRGKIRWETPGDPPRAGTLPYLAYAYRRDPFAISTLRPLLEVQKQLGISRIFRIGTPNLVRPTLPNWIKPDRPYVDDTGSGFIHTLSRFSQTAEGRRILDERLIPWLRELFPHIENLGFTSRSSLLQLEYTSSRYQQPLPAQLESDGVNLALFFTCLPYLLKDSEGDGDPAFVCVGLEEPEAGTHPFFQRNRLELLRRFVRADKNLPVPLQIIATTHSIDLLRWVRKEEALDVLRFVEHLGPEEGTKIHRLVAQADIERVYEEYDRNFGLAWYSGVFGAVPQTPDSDEE